MKKQSGTEPERFSLKSKIGNWLKSVSFKSALIFFVMFVCAFILFCCVTSPRQYDLRVGSIAHETITATKDVIDEVTTEEKRNAAANAVEPTYTFVDGVAEQVKTDLKKVFDELRTVQQYAATLLNEDKTIRTDFTDEEIDYALSLVKSITFSRYQIKTILTTTPEDMEKMDTLVTTAVGNSLNTTIRDGQVNQSIETIKQIVGFKLNVSLNQTIVPTILRTCVKPNMIVDAEALNIARQNARDQVEPVICSQGQNIVLKGEKVKENQLAMLNSLGLLKNNQYDLSVYKGSFLIVLLATVSFLFCLKLLIPDILKDIRRLSVTVSVLLLGLALSVVFHLYFSAYMTTEVLVPMLLTVLLGAEVGFSSIIPYAVLISGLAAGSNNTFIFEMILLLIMSLVNGTVSVLILKDKPQRIRPLLASLVAVIGNIVSIFAISWMTSTESFSILSTLLWSVGGIILSGAMTIAFQPVFEMLFRLPTPSRLQEICNPNQPLLRRLQLEAPGTYHHAIVVANLAEAAAESIGANQHLARAAAYYHDIGKLKRPLYFKENQMGENLHDTLDPYISAAILTSHTKDGYQIAMKEKLPKEIMDIILQHHGDTPVIYFYHKALQLSNGNPVDMSDFRYAGPRPNTKESAIVMLSDTIEAAVRSMREPTEKAINQFIERLVRGKLEDGQLSDSPLTLQDIDKICSAFSGVLRGVFHERIEYPEVRHHIEIARQTHPVGETSKESPEERQQETPHDVPTNRENTAESEPDLKVETEEKPLHEHEPEDTPVPDHECKPETENET